jgi:AraC-like DNA-binding protein
LASACGPEAPHFAQRIRAAYVELRQRHGRRRISPAPNSNLMCFGEALPRAKLDPRVARAMLQIGSFSGEPVTAASCAAEAGLSPSRFLHLFKERPDLVPLVPRLEAGAASAALRQPGHQPAHLAQDIGYPDSTHFSHSIRRFYGLKPRAIFLRLARSGDLPQRPRRRGQ